MPNLNYRKCFKSIFLLLLFCAASLQNPDFAMAAKKGPQGKFLDLCASSFASLLAATQQWSSSHQNDSTSKLANIRNVTKQLGESPLYHWGKTDPLNGLTTMRAFLTKIFIPVPELLAVIQRFEKNQIDPNKDLELMISSLVVIVEKNSNILQKKRKRLTEEDLRTMEALRLILKKSLALLDSYHANIELLPPQPGQALVSAEFQAPEAPAELPQPRGPLLEAESDLVSGVLTSMGSSTESPGELRGASEGGTGAGKGDVAAIRRQGNSLLELFTRYLQLQTAMTQAQRPKPKPINVINEQPDRLAKLLAELTEAANQRRLAQTRTRTPQEDIVSRLDRMAISSGTSDLLHNLYSDLIVNTLRKNLGSTETFRQLDDLIRIGEALATLYPASSGSISQDQSIVKELVRELGTLHLEFADSNQLLARINLSLDDQPEVSLRGLRYLTAVLSVYQTLGKITPDEARALTELRNLFGETPPASSLEAKVLAASFMDSLIGPLSRQFILTKYGSNERGDIANPDRLAEDLVKGRLNLFLYMGELAHLFGFPLRASQVANTKTVFTGAKTIDPNRGAGTTGLSGNLRDLQSTYRVQPLDHSLRDVAEDELAVDMFREPQEVSGTENPGQAFGHIVLTDRSASMGKQYNVYKFPFAMAFLAGYMDYLTSNWKSTSISHRFVEIPFEVQPLASTTLNSLAEFYAFFAKTLAYTQPEGNGTNIKLAIYAGLDKLKASQRNNEPLKMATITLITDGVDDVDQEDIERYAERVLPGVPVVLNILCLVEGNTDLENMARNSYQGNAQIRTTYVYLSADDLEDMAKKAGSLSLVRSLAAAVHSGAHTSTNGKQAISAALKEVRRALSRSNSTVQSNRNSLQRALKDQNQYHWNQQGLDFLLPQKTKTAIDEIARVFNVMKNTSSIAGPLNRADFLAENFALLGQILQLPPEKVAALLSVKNKQIFLNWINESSSTGGRP